MSIDADKRNESSLTPETLTDAEKGGGKTKKKPSRGMSQRYGHFCRAYAFTGNATQAAAEAGYSPDNANQQGYRLLKRPEIIAEVERLKVERGEELKKNRLIRLQAIRDKDSWLAEVVKVYDEIDNPESPQRLKALEIVGKSLGHLSESTSAPNLLQIDNRSFHSHLEVTAEALKIAEKLKLIGLISKNETPDLPQVITPQQVTDNPN